MKQSPPAADKASTTAASNGVPLSLPNRDDDDDTIESSVVSYRPPLKKRKVAVGALPPVDSTKEGTGSFAISAQTLDTKTIEASRSSSETNENDSGFMEISAPSQEASPTGQKRKQSAGRSQSSPQKPKRPPQSSLSLIEESDLKLYDVILGNGSTTVSKASDLYQCLVWDTRTLFLHTPMPLKEKVAQQNVLSVIEAKGGRFLIPVVVQEGRENGEDNVHSKKKSLLPQQLYLPVSNEVALERTCRALRESSKDTVLPSGYHEYLKEKEKQAGLRLKEARLREQKQKKKKTPLLAEEETVEQPIPETALNPYDVLVGRGNGTACYQGNIFFRCLVWDAKPLYQQAVNSEKVVIAQQHVLSIIYAKGGRVLEPMVGSIDSYKAPKKDTRSGKTKKAQQWYQIVSHSRAIEKACQALRERKINRPPTGYDDYLAQLGLEPEQKDPDSQKATQGLEREQPKKKQQRQQRQVPRITLVPPPSKKKKKEPDSPEAAQGLAREQPNKEQRQVPRITLVPPPFKKKKKEPDSQEATQGLEREQPNKEQRQVPRITLVPPPSKNKKKENRKLPLVRESFASEAGNSQKSRSQEKLNAMVAIAPRPVVVSPIPLLSAVSRAQRALPLMSKPKKKKARVKSSQSTSTTLTNLRPTTSSSSSETSSKFLDIAPRPSTMVTAQASCSSIASSSVSSEQSMNQTLLTSRPPRPTKSSQKAFAPLDVLATVAGIWGTTTSDSSCSHQTRVKRESWKDLCNDKCCGTNELLENLNGRRVD